MILRELIFLKTDLETNFLNLKTSKFFHNSNFWEIKKYLNLKKKIYWKDPINNTGVNLTPFKCVLLSSVQEWLLGRFWPFFTYLHNQLSSIHSIITYLKVKCLKNVIHQIESKYEWLLFSASFTVKFGLVFVLTLENAFCQRFQQKEHMFF